MHFSAINLSNTYALPIILSLIQINHIYFSTLSDLSRNTIQFNTAIYQSKNFSPLNAIKYILKHLQHTFQLLIYHTLTLYPSYSLLIQINHRHFSTHQTYRGTQFNLTLCDLPIKKLLASQRNQIYSEASSTHFSAINLSYFTLYSSKCSLFQIHHYISENNQSYRGTQFNLTLCDYQSKHFSPPNANKYILKHLQHTFQLLIYQILTLYPSYSYWSK